MEFFGIALGCGERKGLIFAKSGFLSGTGPLRFILQYIVYGVGSEN